MSISVRQANIFFMVLSGIILNIFSPQLAISSDILFHEEIDGEAIIYRISPDGTNLNKIGQGLFPQWSPDGKYISYVEYLENANPAIVKGLVIIEPTGKEVIRIRKKDITSIIRYSWNPNNKGIALVTVFNRNEGSILYYDLETKQFNTIKKVEFESFDAAFLTTSLEWSSDGRQLLFSFKNRSQKDPGIFFIDIKSGVVKNISEIGMFSRLMGNKIIFVIGSEIWVINPDGSGKKKLLEVGMSIVGLSKVVNNKLILQTYQTNEKFDEKESPFKLYLLNLDDKNNLQEIGSKNHLLLCPNISPDSNKFTSIGVRFKKDEQIVSEEERELGYYLFDIKTGAVTLLKKFEDQDKGEGFWWGVYAGYGNHTSWN